MEELRLLKRRVLTVLLTGLVLFGFGPALLYGQLCWLLNTRQWWWTYFCYLWEVPVVGGLLVIWPAWRMFQPIVRLLEVRQTPTWDPTRLIQACLAYPVRVAVTSATGVVVGYTIGMTMVHLIAHQTWEEVTKTIIAIPLVASLIACFYYVGLSRVLQPTVAWASLQLPTFPPTRWLSVAKKVFISAQVLVIGSAILIGAMAYTRGQVIVEEQLKGRLLAHLEFTLARSLPDEELLKRAFLGRHGYAVIVDSTGKILSPHPKGFQSLSQEGLFEPVPFQEHELGIVIDRVQRHRLIAHAPLTQDRFLVSIADPRDFARPLRTMLVFSLIVLVEVVVIAAILGNYFAKGLTQPLAELTQTIQRITERKAPTEQVAISTDDEIGRLAFAFNRMVRELDEARRHMEQTSRRHQLTAEELAQMNVELEQLIHVASHDLRAPLINISGFSKRLEWSVEYTASRLAALAKATQDGPLKQQLEELAHLFGRATEESTYHMEQGIEKMDRLLNGLLAISRVGRKGDPPSPVDLNYVLDEAMDTLKLQLTKGHIKLIRHPLPTVMGRRNELFQVFANLLSNAIKFMGNGAARHIEVGATEQPDAYACFVKDTGIGIDPQDHEKIFQMFIRLDDIDMPGEGVGLAYVKKIIRSHGGKIWVESTKGRGSTFFFALPKYVDMVRGAVL